MAEVTKERYWITEHPLSHRFVTYGPNKTRVAIGATKIGPFESKAKCCEWLAANAALHHTYSILPEREP